MVEIVVLSGKGGTGKTSLTAAFAHLSSRHVICDLDVDAPDLHLLLAPQQLETEAFVSGFAAAIRPEDCTACGVCAERCRYDAIIEGPEAFRIDSLRCEGCKVCVAFCPADAIDFTPRHCGDWYRSDTRFGPMIHAQLFPGEENSGRLVALLRQKAKIMSEQDGLDLILSDGPPGIGCPVISSLSGAAMAVIVTEPTPSGLHDLERIVELCAFFKIPTGVIVNKFDLHTKRTGMIEDFCTKNGLAMLGKLPHDQVMTEAMVAAKTVTEYAPDSALAGEIRRIWQNIEGWSAIRAAA